MLWRKEVPLVLDFSGDFHFGHPNPPDRNPTEEMVRESLQSALDRKVDGYVMVGDGVHDNSVEEAHRLAQFYKEYTSQGLSLFVMRGNHDSTGEIQRIYQDEGGAQLLDGKVVTLGKGRRSVSLIGVTTEYGEKWWEAEDPEAARERVRKEALSHEKFLQHALHTLKTRNIIVVTHRGIIPETVGSAPLYEKARLSPQVEGLQQIVKNESRTRILRRKRHIVFVHGHDHGEEPWEGGLEGKIGDVTVHNDAAPLRKRMGLPISRTMRI